MRLPFSAILALLAGYSKAIQPDAVRAYEAPLRELPWGKVNFLHTTDVHGWLAGHLQEPSFSADWGDYISFAHHLRAKADADGSDLLLVDTGDRIEGNGLYDGSDPKGKYYFDIFKNQDIDLMSIGNHELYKANSSIDELHQTVPNYKNSYIASNLDIIDPDRGTREPLAQRYRKFTTKNQKLRILSFGFLFDFTGNANNTFVQPIEEAIKEDWFREALSDKEVDLIVVIGHVGIRMTEYKVIYQAIRDAHWDTPIAFFGGHVHVRDYTTYDKSAVAIASGRYMETVGFLSIDGIEAGKTKSKVFPKFARRYIDKNLFSFHQHTGLNKTTFPTELGRNVSKAIAKARSTLKLNEKYGCAPAALFVNRAPYPSDNSIFSWLADHVLPAQIGKASRVRSKGKKTLIITNTGAMRFDIFEGPFTKDTEFLVSPFTSEFRYVPEIPVKVAARVLDLLNSKGPILEAMGSDGAALKEWMVVPPEQIGGIMAEQSGFAQTEEMRVSTGAQQVLGTSKKPDLKPGYTTKDDAGTDGDDTEHSRIDFYNVPNCIQATVGIKLPLDPNDDSTVDLVYNEFVESWIVLALQYLGLKTTVADTKPYMEGKTVTNLITDWIEEHWKCK
ncbi:hypothetical protein BT63DRAFT_444299 [Microthyrium microscopicum]|uniref:Uncharacterized protein n=1 Tax=Microthyrium microscopicum TaxID=703497 RepID=A0A6A6TUU1_9PEZI|nr:hypothetical protein BT63DRAFT_444299 [Microthyrium microscopicum]